MTFKETDSMEAVTSQKLRCIAEQSLKRNGWTVTKKTGPLPSGARKGGSVRRITKNGESKLIAIKTSQDTWISFAAHNRRHEVGDAMRCGGGCGRLRG